MNYVSASKKEIEDYVGCRLYTNNTENPDVKPWSFGPDRAGEFLATIFFVIEVIFITMAVVMILVLIGTSAPYFYHLIKVLLGDEAPRKRRRRRMRRRPSINSINDPEFRTHMQALAEVEMIIQRSEEDRHDEPVTFETGPDGRTVPTNLPDMFFVVENLHDGNTDRSSAKIQASTSSFALRQQQREGIGAESRASAHNDHALNGFEMQPLLPEASTSTDRRLRRTRSGRSIKKGRKGSKVGSEIE